MRVANIDIALDCQAKGQPVGGSVEDLRSCLQRKLKQKARKTAPFDGGMTTKGEGIDIPDEQEDKPKESEAESYQGAGRMMVRRSHMAIGQG